MSCPNCGHEVNAGAKFCEECGTRIGTSAAAERRQLTLMFCDLVESTQLSRLVDEGFESWDLTEARTLLAGLS